MGLFLVLFLLFYVLAMKLLTLAPVSLRDHLSPIFKPLAVLSPGGSTLPRYQEFEEVENVDILFVGSSHCYRTFDTRFWKGMGYKVFNMGSSGQTPMNSYYLLRDQLDRLNPDLVVMEVFWWSMSIDGVESFLDLIRNRPLDRDLIAMGLRTHNLHACNSLLIKMLESDPPDYEALAARPLVNETYIDGGFVEIDPDYSTFLPFNRTVDPIQEQMEYLARLIQMLQDHGSEVYLVVQPIPTETILSDIPLYPQIDKEMTSFAQRLGVPYLDFNRYSFLRDTHLFYDTHHMRQEAVIRFNQAFYDSLSVQGYLPPVRVLIQPN